MHVTWLKTSEVKTKKPKNGVLMSLLMFWWKPKQLICIQLTSIFALIVPNKSFHQVPAKHSGFRGAFVPKSQPSSCWRVRCVMIVRVDVAFCWRTGFSRKSFISGHWSVMHQILVEVDAEQAANELTGRDPPREKGEDAPEENGREDPT